MKVLVLGGYGAVGTRIAANLRELGDTVWAAGRDATRADRIVDLDDIAGYRQAIDDVEVVVNAGVENPMLAKLAAEEGAAFVDITATIEYIRELERLKPPRPVLVSVGLAPGLSNLLAAEVHGVPSGPIDLVLILGAGERHGRGGDRLVRPANQPAVSGSGRRR